MPLCWAHAEYVTLVHSRHAGHPLDRIPEAFQRYVENPENGKSDTEFWSLAHRTRKVLPGHRLILLLSSPICIHWKHAGDSDFQEFKTLPAFAGLHIATLEKVEKSLEFSLGDDETIYRIEVG